MDDKISPCADDALQRQVRQIVIDDKPVGIVWLDEAIREVQALGLSSDAEIKTALMQRIAEHNDIPPSASEAYASSLAAEFYAERMKMRMQQGIKNYSRMHPG